MSVDTLDILELAPPFELTVTPPTSSITASTSSAPEGSSVTITVTVLDSSGNPVVGATVVLETTPSGGPGDGLTQITDSSGVASFIVTSASIGTWTITATANAVAVPGSVTLTFTAVPPPPPPAKSGMTGPLGGGTQRRWKRKYGGRSVLKARRKTQ